MISEYITFRMLRFACGVWLGVGTEHLHIEWLLRAFIAATLIGQ